MARLGLGDTWACLLANDLDPLKAETYRANFGGDHLTLGDVWALAAADLPGRADLAWASSPCQDLSLAGARAGLGGARSSAFWGFWRQVAALDAEGRAPGVIVLENVAGLLSSNDGGDLAAIGQAFDARGYRFGALEIDAADFLPQSRPRAFVIAARAAMTAWRATDRAPSRRRPSSAHTGACPRRSADSGFGGAFRLRPAATRRSLACSSPTIAWRGGRMPKPPPCWRRCGRRIAPGSLRRRAAASEPSRRSIVASASSMVGACSARNCAWTAWPAACARPAAARRASSWSLSRGSRRAAAGLPRAKGRG